MILEKKYKGFNRLEIERPEDVFLNMCVREEAKITFKKTGACFLKP